ncbi:MAG: ABC transporter ATP-binding protein [Acidimicrobiia bacterium]|nr:ABC transporter ATP-binding protein [Acidimicrobiia bacterium]
MPAPAIELRGITKRYPGVVANRDVNLRVESGTAHAVIGENGAGKSTLMNILYGMVVPDEGEILVEGTPIPMSSPADAIAAGIGMVHQHFKLADNLTVLENVILGDEPTGRAGRIDFEAARARIVELGDHYRIPIDPEALVADLSVGNRQRGEIITVLYRGARVLILDEPTSVLVPQEVDELLKNLRRLTGEGLTVIFISHKLDEVLTVADEITVMRNARTVAHTRPAEITSRELAQLMVGSELPTPEPRTVEVRSEVGLRLESVSTRGSGHETSLSDIDLTVRSGEIVGIAGVEGNGQSELIETILGLTSPVAGRVLLGTEDVTEAATSIRRRLGLSYIPQDRHREALLLDATLWENRMLGHQMHPPINRGVWIDRKAARADTEQIVADSDVRTPSIEVLASALSGGNQQKLIVGREMAGEPRVLIAAHPTRGVDVGAQAAIWTRLSAVRRAGVAVLLISADLEELIGISDRILVILRGRFVGEFDPAAIGPEDLGAAMTGADAA